MRLAATVLTLTLSGTASADCDITAPNWKQLCGNGASYDSQIPGKKLEQKPESLTEEVGFVVTEPTFEEAWIIVCWDAAIFRMDAEMCKLGRYATKVQDGKTYSIWTAEKMKMTDAATPAVQSRLSAERHQAIGRMNIAFREMRRRGIPADEARTMCGDPSIVNAYVNARAGVEIRPNIVIQDNR